MSLSLPPSPEGPASCRSRSHLAWSVYPVWMCPSLMCLWWWCVRQNTNKVTGSDAIHLTAKRQSILWWGRTKGILMWPVVEMPSSLVSWGRRSWWSGDGGWTQSGWSGVSHCLSKNWCWSFSEYSNLASLTALLNLYLNYLNLSLSPQRFFLLPL